MDTCCPACPFSTRVRPVEWVLAGPNLEVFVRVLHQRGDEGSHRVDPPGWPALGGSLTRAIKWELVAQQYDQMVKYATALRLGTAESESILRR